jgi:hypothetical protein
MQQVYLPNDHYPVICPGQGTYRQVYIPFSWV